MVENEISFVVSSEEHILDGVAHAVAMACCKHPQSEWLDLRWRVKGPMFVDGDPLAQRWEIAIVKIEDVEVRDDVISGTFWDCHDAFRADVE